MDLIGARRGHVMELLGMPPEDFETCDIICKADTIGVFQMRAARTVDAAAPEAAHEGEEVLC